MNNRTKIRIPSRYVHTSTRISISFVIFVSATHPTTLEFFIENEQNVNNYTLFLIRSLLLYIKWTDHLRKGGNS